MGFIVKSTKEVIIVKHDNNNSFSLLSQQEIDTLVSFLTDKKAVNSDVLSQKSIDKLISFIQSDPEKVGLESLLSYDAIDATFLKKLQFRENDSDICELQFDIIPSSSYICIKVYNTVTGQTLTLTPELFDETDTEDWGFAIPPVFFNHIASILDIKYSQETYDLVCKTFKKISYGDASHKIPKIYLPSNEEHLECLL